MNKTIIILLLALLILPLASAEVQDLGTFKIQNQVVLKQICDNCTFVNITSVYLQGVNSRQVLGQVVMTKVGTEYTYTLLGSNTTTAGDYIVNGFGDLDGSNQVWNYGFVITPSGLINQLGFYFIMIVLVYGLFALGIWKEDITITMLATFGMYAIGLYILFNGLDVYKNFATSMFAWITLGVAFYTSAMVAQEYLDIEI